MNTVLCPVPLQRTYYQLTHSPIGQGRSTVDVDCHGMGEVDVSVELRWPGVGDDRPRGREVPVHVKQVLGILC